MGAELTAGDALNEILRLNDLDQPSASPEGEAVESAEGDSQDRWLSEGIASGQPLRFDSPTSVATANNSYVVEPESMVLEEHAPIHVGSFDTGLSLLSSDPQLPAAEDYSENISAPVLETAEPSGLPIAGGEKDATGAVSSKSRTGSMDSGAAMNVRLAGGSDGGGGGGGSNLQADSTGEGESTGEGAGDSEASPSASEPTDVEVAYLMDASLDGWEVRESGGSETGKGGVTVDGGEVVLREGDSSLVDLRYTLTVPENPGTLTFEYTSLAFDATATDSVRDAFEFALLDEAGNSLTPVFDSAGRDSAFNVTEGLGAALGADTTHEVFGDAGIVNLDISSLSEGTQAVLLFRLVNGDTDVETTVRLRRGDPVLQVTTDGPATANQFAPAEFSGSFAHPGRPDPSYQYEWTVVDPNGDTLLRNTEVVGESGIDSLEFTPEIVGGYDVTLRVIGSEGSIGTATSSLEVIEPQPVQAETSLSVPENSPAGTIVGSVSSGADTTGITFAITGGDLADAFAIDDQGVITVADPTLLDAEGQASGSVTVTASLVVDPDRTWTGVANVEITNVNEPPGDFALSSDEVPENAPAGTLVGTISAFDPEDPDATLSFELLDGEGNPGHPLFEIVGNELRTRAPLDFEDEASYPLTIRATHPNGESGEATLEVNVADINEPPVVVYNGPESDILDSDPSLWDISWTIIDPEGTETPNGIASARSILTLDGAVYGAQDYLVTHFLEEGVVISASDFDELVERNSVLQEKEEAFQTILRGSDADAASAAAELIDEIMDELGIAQQLWMRHPATVEWIVHALTLNKQEAISQELIRIAAGLYDIVCDPRIVAAFETLMTSRPELAWDVAAANTNMSFPAKWNLIQETLQSKRVDNSVVGLLPHLADAPREKSVVFLDNLLRLHQECKNEGSRTELLDAICEILKPEDLPKILARPNGRALVDEIREQLEHFGDPEGVLEVL